MINHKTAFGHEVMRWKIAFWSLKIQCLNICPIITCVKIWDGTSPNACGCNIQDSSERCRKAAWACHDLRWVSNKLCYIMLDSVTLGPKNHCFHPECLETTLFTVFRCCLKRHNLRHCTQHQWPINLFNGLIGNVQNPGFPFPSPLLLHLVQNSQRVWTNWRHLR